MFNRRGFGMLPAVALSLAITGGIFGLLGYIRSSSKASVRMVTLMEYGVVTKAIAESFANLIAKAPRLDPTTLSVDLRPYTNLSDAANDNCWMGRLLMSENMASHEKGYNANLGRNRNDLSILTGRPEAGAVWCGERGYASDGPGLYMMVKKTSVLGGTQMKAMMDVIEKTDPHFGGIVVRAVRKKSVALPSDIDGTILEITATVIPASTIEKVMGTRKEVRHKITRLFMRHNLMEYALATPGRLRMDQEYTESLTANSRPGPAYRNTDSLNYVGDISIPHTTLTEFADSRNRGITFYSPILINGDVTLPPKGKAALANFRKPIEMGKGTLMRMTDGNLAPFRPTVASAQMKGTLDELKSMMRGQAGFYNLGERSTALDVLYGVKPVTVGSLATTCISNLKNFDPSESRQSCLVMKEVPSRTVASTSKGTVTLSTQTQNFISAYTNERNEFVPQDGPSSKSGAMIYNNGVEGTIIKAASVTGEDSAPIYKLVFALSNSADTDANIPAAGRSRVDAALGLNQTATVQFAAAGKCDPATLEQDKKTNAENLKAAETARDAVGSQINTSKSMAGYLDDVLTAAKAATGGNNGNQGNGNNGNGNNGNGNGNGDPTPTPTIAANHNKLDNPDLNNWYNANRDNPLTSSSDLDTVTKYIHDEIDDSFAGPTTNELGGYLSEKQGAPYDVVYYGCTNCDAVKTAFQNLFKRVHYESLKKLAEKYDQEAKDLAVRETYTNNPLTLEFSVLPHSVRGDRGDEVQPNINKLSVTMHNMESWKVCGKAGYSPDVSVVGYELGYDGSQTLSSGRIAHPLWSNVNRLFWKFNNTKDRLDLLAPPSFSGTYSTLNPNFPNSNTPDNPGNAPSLTRNYAAERKTCEDTGDYRFGNVGSEDFDLLAKVAWNFADDGTGGPDMTITSNTIDTLVAPAARGDYNWPIRTGLNSLTIDDTADIMVGNYVTESMSIASRRTPLMIVATVITKKLTIHPNALKAGITWIAPQDEAALPVLTRAVFGRGMDCSALKNPNLAFAPLWHPTLKLMSSFPSDISVRMAMSCTLASIAPKMGEAFSSTNGSPPETPNLSTAVSRMDMSQYFKGAWSVKPVAEDESEAWY